MEVCASSHGYERERLYSYLNIRRVRISTLMWFFCQVLSAQCLEVYSDARGCRKDRVYNNALVCRDVRICGKIKFYRNAMLCDTKDFYNNEKFLMWSRILHSVKEKDRNGSKSVY
ncbi:hypothetical protein GGR08_001282 [Bartonella fuyuanensis]|uniref:Uncharacterized protein n=1 Tax=Bartonella fuyuanensis TaxID=1460968 RepID=A0A840E1W4_9HYPH|nr:hypothetical protein [Bartonella fuyuanensis]